VSHKVYVAVTAKFDEDGSITPLDITWVDGRVYTVDRVLNKCRVASLKAGGIGLRYTCRIDGKETHLWQDDSRWYVESKREMGVEMDAEMDAEAEACRELPFVVELDAG